MPVDFLASVVIDGPQAIPYWDQIKEHAPTVLPIVASIGAAKYYFRGATNTWERDMHGKVYMITGGTSGIGASIAYELAQKGAQLIFLTRRTNDLWLAEYIEDLRDQTSNSLLYAEECDLNSLYSIRKFVTKWLDNQPPRRLDGVICCAAEAIPRNSQRQITVDGVEKQIGINYLGHFHLLTLLEPSLKVQPPDRDVRVLIATCSSQNLGEVDLEDLLWENKRYPVSQPWKLYGTSKLLLGLFAKHYQRQLMAFERKDQAPCNIRINMVNPGLVRSPSTRRFLSMGTIWGLILYVLLFPIWWLCLKSVGQGAQTFYFGLFAPIFPKIEGGNILQECKIVTKSRREYSDEELQEKVFHNTQELIKKLETQSAMERNKNKSKEELLKEKEEKLKKKRDLNIQPKSTEELEHKLDALRSQIGIGTSSGVKSNGAAEELPLFPDEEALKNARSTARSSGAGTTLTKGANGKGNSKQKGKKKT
ncbi:hypothetical protein PVL30_000579 [Lodderomyces elongisporus]|uniref:uncharacterized protein n=1 Tax=Lodderomyces elongisporus TaxID=36914 RepID=UPI00291FF31D|nr:uncharacterized protein PVL30_000579 [Lodderomyces elongisporus]WLF76874.1 hypothetical protein PVL30_000579 [Lodderomyces elongisporus]